MVRCVQGEGKASPLPVYQELPFTLSDSTHTPPSVAHVLCEKMHMLSMMAPRMRGPGTAPIMPHAICRERRGKWGGRGQVFLSQLRQVTQIRIAGIHGGDGGKVDVRGDR